MQPATEVRRATTGRGTVIDIAISPSSGELFAAYHDRIRRYVQSMVHDPDEAEDLTQDVFLQAHRRLGSVRNPDAVISWLYRIATHACYDRFRQWSRRPQSASLESADLEETEATETGDASLDRVIERAEMSACVRGYLDALSDDYRNVILLHDVEALSTPEIGGMLGVSVGAVKIRLHRARRRLQDVLSANCALSYDEHGVLVCESTAATKSPAGAVASSDRVSLGIIPSS